MSDAADDADAPVADLHVHTTVSDGTLALEEVPAAAREAGVDWVALTDHDRYHPDLDAPLATRDGVTLVRGIELRVETGPQRIDLLGYGLERTEALSEEVDRLQRDRIERGRRMIERVEAHLGVDLDLEPAEGLGRPHVARAIADSAADYGYDEAFEVLIGHDDPCYVARNVTDAAVGADLLREACAVVSLAHPFRYPDPEAALDLAVDLDLDGVERYYPYDRTVDPAPVDRVIAEHDLLATGGSDAHERTLGLAGPPRAAFEPLKRRLTEAT